MVRDVLTLVLPTGNEGRVEDGSGLRAEMELSVYLGVLGELGLWESRSTRVSSLRHMGINLVPVTRCQRGAVAGELVDVDNGITGDNFGELRCEVLRGSSLEVLGFLVHLEVVSWVIG